MDPTTVSGTKNSFSTPSTVLSTLVHWYLYALPRGQKSGSREARGRVPAAPDGLQDERAAARRRAAAVERHRHRHGHRRDFGRRRQQPRACSRPSWHDCHDRRQLLRPRVPAGQPWRVLALPARRLHARCSTEPGQVLVLGPYGHRGRRGHQPEPGDARCAQELREPGAGRASSAPCSSPTAGNDRPRRRRGKGGHRRRIGRKQGWRGRWRRRP